MYVAQCKATVPVAAFVFTRATVELDGKVNPLKFLPCAFHTPETAVSDMSITRKSSSGRGICRKNLESGASMVGSPSAVVGRPASQLLLACVANGCPLYCLCL